MVMSIGFEEVVGVVEDGGHILVMIGADVV
jgi:hypothetical protein